MRCVLGALIAAALLVGGCGGGSGGSNSPPANAPSQAEEDRKDTQAIEKQVNKQIGDRAQNKAVKEGDFVQADTSCTKQSDTAYKCITTFTSPSGFPEELTDVTCDRNGGSCITETR